MDIKFGTDGWRAIIADDYTVENLKRVASATAQWLLDNNKKPSVIIGHDTRFGGKMFSRITARVMGNYGIKTYLNEDYVSTPMISLGTEQYKANAGIIITASHNPPEYNGFKIKAYYGGPALPEMISEVEEFIPDNYDEPLVSINEMKERGLLEYTDLQELYFQHAKSNFDLERIHKSGFTVAFDAMYGATQSIFKRLLPDTVTHRCEYNPSFKDVAPEPIPKNLQSFAKLINDNDHIDIGVANDGDGDRIGVLDNNGRFIDSHHLILLLMQYLIKHKDMKGMVINSFSCTSKITKLCEKYGIKQKITKIGFKYIAGEMLQNKALIGAEESGGIALANHIPERDGVWVALTLLEYMATTHQSLEEIIDKLYEETGEFWVDRNDLHIENEIKKQVMENCEKGHYSNFGNYDVEKTDNLDGYKFFLGEDRWVLIRPSGTEPVLRIYAEGKNAEEVNDILQSTEDAILEKVE